jgi:hypothetical protein
MQSFETLSAFGDIRVTAAAGGGLGVGTFHSWPARSFQPLLFALALRLGSRVVGAGDMTAK